MTTLEVPTMWVVELTFPEKTGFTLWGQPGPGDDDRVLTADGHVLLFSSVAALRAFATADRGSSFAQSPAYAAWRDAANDEEATSYDFVEVGATLGLPDDRWDMGSCSLVVDGVNMLTDLAASVGLAGIVDRWSNGPHGGVLDALTFVAEDDLLTALTALNPRRTLDGYLADLAAVTAHTRLVS